jgi:putative DNA primase/helicase
MIDTQSAPRAQSKKSAPQSAAHDTLPAELRANGISCLSKPDCKQRLAKLDQAQFRSLFLSVIRSRQSYPQQITDELITALGRLSPALVEPAPAPAPAPAAPIVIGSGIDTTGAAIERHKQERAANGNGNGATIEIDELPVIDEEALERLAKMPRGIARDRERKRLAREFGCSQTSIDDEVKSRQGDQAHPLHDHWLVEPWPEPVETDALVRDLCWRIHSHVVCSYEDMLAVSLWIMLAWSHEAATHSPLLLVTSAEPECGKTTMLGVVTLLAPRSISTVEISDAALYRSIEVWHPTFVIDEFDNVLADDAKRQLRSVINSGHTRGDGVLKVNKDTHEPELFPTFGPKAIGMVGRRLPATTMSRCIVVQLQRRKAGEKIAEKFQHKDTPELRDLRARLLRWSTDNVASLRSAKDTVAMPGSFDNRRADNWRVLFSIADLAGEEIAEHVRHAAQRIEGSVDTRSIRARLLADIRSIFYPVDEETGTALERLDRISTNDLIAQLALIPGAPWSDWKGGKRIDGGMTVLTDRQLSQLLGEKISPKPLRLRGREPFKGYERIQFEDDWERYLSLGSR